jgi:hypothetical protein
MSFGVLFRPGAGPAALVVGLMSNFQGNQSPWLPSGFRCFARCSLLLSKKFLLKFLPRGYPPKPPPKPPDLSSFIRDHAGDRECALGRSEHPSRLSLNIYLKFKPKLGPSKFH